MPTRGIRSALGFGVALILAVTLAIPASAQMVDDGYRYRTECVGASEPAAQARGFGVLKIKGPGASAYVQWPSNPDWHTHQAKGSYNGGYWRAVATAQLNYEETFGFCLG